MTCRKDNIMVSGDKSAFDLTPDGYPAALVS